MLIVGVKDVSNIVNKVGIDKFFLGLIDYLEEDFKNWDDFFKVPRLATHTEVGVVELMPTASSKYYTYKYVNGHPKNPELHNLPTVMATGQLALLDSGLPLMISEMTLLTGLRTGATSSMVAKKLSRKNSSVIAIIGTGAQSEFQIRAMKTVRELKEVRYFDTDPLAMDKFEKNMKDANIKLTRCSSISEAVTGADIVTTATAAKFKQIVIDNHMINDGVFINAIGGDCPGKTEIDENILKRSKVVVEYTPQSLIEGEIQNIGADVVYSEFWEILNDKKDGRSNDSEVTLFDSVGFAIEDYSVLRYIYDLAKKYKLGKEYDLLPDLTKDPKDLFVSLKS